MTGRHEKTPIRSSAVNLFVKNVLSYAVVYVLDECS